MRTYFNNVITNRTVFGLNQDRVVSLSDTCAHAAQHLASRHAAKRARSTDRALKRRGSVTTVMAGAVLMAKQWRLAITGPQWQPVRLLSPVPVMA
jgi:hypothetical protein